MNKNIINLTPHAINIILETEKTITIEPSGTIARCKTNTVLDGSVGYVENDQLIDMIPITKTEFGEVKNLPEPIPYVIFIVSSLVAQACKDRNDIFIPNDTVRNEAGQIIGCKSLGRI